MSFPTRKALAVLLPGAFQIVAVFSGSLLKELGIATHIDGSLFAITIYVLSISLGVYALGRGSSYSFWKAYPFALIAAALPITIFFLVSAVTRGTAGYFWLGVIVVSVLLVVAAVISLPFALLVYSFSRTKADNRKLR